MYLWSGICFRVPPDDHILGKDREMEKVIHVIETGIKRGLKELDYRLWFLSEAIETILERKEK
tara:strand:- start:826 stop:1014 length:189 start_codon:yes stop_codon:yes gene_type:complete